MTTFFFYFFKLPWVPYSLNLNLTLPRLMKYYIKLKNDSKNLVDTDIPEEEKLKAATKFKPII